MLEYEIEFPASYEGDCLPVLPGGICDIEMPSFPIMKDAEVLNCEVSNFPTKPCEKSKIPEMPQSVWD